MDNGPMWSQDEVGHYWLLFPNKHALSKEEIRDIFSSFGKILNVTAAGDERGLRFVQFSSLEDVERAVDNLKNHPTIKLVPHRPKNNKNNQNSNNGSKDGQQNSVTFKPQSTNDSAKRNFYQRKPTRNCNESMSHSESQFHSAFHNDESVSFNHLVKNTDCIGNHDSTSSCSSNASSYNANFVQSSPKNNLLHQTSPTKSIALSSSPNLMNPANRAQALLKLRGTNANTFSISGSYSNNINNTISNTYEDEIPDLVTKDKINSYKEPKKIILNAEEVIVANIHDEFGSAYILHLFEKYEPLAISYIKVLPKSETRYCHVYFKTARDSLEVETEYDKYNLSGKKLVVLRPCRLMEEAMYEV